MTRQKKRMSLHLSYCLKSLTAEVHYIKSTKVYVECPNKIKQPFQTVKYM